MTEEALSNKGRMLAFCEQHSLGPECLEDLLYSVLDRNTTAAMSEDDTEIDDDDYDEAYQNARDVAVIISSGGLRSQVSFLHDQISFDEFKQILSDKFLD